ncbi:MAG: bifunctional phosphopantothenoylcysteine decarboxylase/phosphopantothenate--cysteine ligase CoaBC, partial [bacterium]
MIATKKIALGVTGGIAAYKACELVRELKKSGAEVRVVMTEAAQKFVAPQTFATLSENPVLLSLFDQNENVGVVHLDLARWCDALVVCPATANIIGKVAGGIADNALSTIIMATKAPVLFCPAMNSVMWENSFVQENIFKLKNSGYQFVEPEWGPLATSAEGEGWGRLASLTLILQKLKYLLLSTEELKGQNVLVTAGPTREAIDPVRFITNYSSGKMGFALAEAAKLKGAEVVLISGPNQIQKLEGVRYIEVTTVEQMHNAITREYKNTNILLMAAAVSDFKPVQISQHKLKKSQSKIILELAKTTDILASLGKKKEGRIHVGFAVETEDEVSNATKKLHSKNLDMVVINNPLQEGAAFAGDTNKVTIISKDGTVEELPKLSKFEVANIILDKVCHMVRNKIAKAVA